MRAFRYGGVNVTYFLPKSMYKLNSSFDPVVYDRLALPSVGVVRDGHHRGQWHFFRCVVREESADGYVVPVHASDHVAGRTHSREDCRFGLDGRQLRSFEDRLPIERTTTLARTVRRQTLPNDEIGERDGERCIDVRRSFSSRSKDTPVTCRSTSMANASITL